MSNNINLNQTPNIKQAQQNPNRLNFEVQYKIDSIRLMEKLSIWIYENHFLFNWNELVWILLTTLELTVQKWKQALEASSI